MDRLQKKCIIASTTAHSLLLGVLLFGSALMPSPKGPDFKPITVYSSKDVTDALSSGGSPDAAVAPPPLPPAPVTPKQDLAPTLPKPKTPEPVVKPIAEPPKIEHHEAPKTQVELPKQVKIKPPKDDVVTPPKKPHTIDIDPSALKQVVRNKSEKNDQAQAAADARARAERKRIANQIASTYKAIGSHMSSSTPVELPPGVGGPGPVSVNYGSIISSKYFDAWSPPTDLDESMPDVEASVTIARDGSVISARISKSSGNVSLDRSIRNALENVKFIEPFPPSFKQEQITVTVPFNLRTKRQTG